MFDNISSNPNCWDMQKANSWYSKIRRPLGFNYLPRTAVNSTEFLQNKDFNELVIDQEMGWAAKIGYNSCRVFLQYLLWEKEGELFLKNFDKFLAICDRKNIKVIPVLFDDCAFSALEPYTGEQNPPKPFTHNSGWTPSPGETIADDHLKYGDLEKYVKSVITGFNNDSRILFWDMYNEAGNSKRGCKSLYLLEKSFEWARQCSPTAPLTACIWGFLNGDATKDSVFIDLRAAELSDIITFHFYGNAKRMENLISDLSRLGRPVICTEWLARIFFECYVETVLPVFDRHDVGCIHWGLVNGKTQTHYPWGWDASQGEPDKWFHDILKSDETPYSHDEVNLIKEFSKNCTRRSEHEKTV
jgi:hypothetical protein